MLYNIFLSAHIISFTAWMAGMFYLPRLFVYHSQKDVGTDSSETFKIMERKLLKIIMNPAMISTWVFGFLLIGHIGFEIMLELWLQIKLLLVLFMSGCHGFFAKIVRNFDTRSTVTHKRKPLNLSQCFIVSSVFFRRHIISILVC